MLMRLITLNLKNYAQQKVFYVLAILLLGLHSCSLTVIRNMKVQTSFSLQTGPILKPEHFPFVNWSLHYFFGLLFSIILGVWVVPYWHQGQRKLLTFSYAIPKWKFVIGHLASFIVFQLVLVGVMVLVFGYQFGFPATLEMVPTRQFLYCFLLECVSLSTVMLLFSTLSLYFNVVPAFLLGIPFVLFTQWGSFFERLISIEKYFAIQLPKAPYLIKTLHFLPPFGEIPFQLWRAFSYSEWDNALFGRFVLWMLGFFALASFRLRYPGKN